MTFATSKHHSLISCSKLLWCSQKACILLKRLDIRQEDGEQHWFGKVHRWCGQMSCLLRIITQGNIISKQQCYWNYCSLRSFIYDIGTTCWHQCLTFIAMRGKSLFITLSNKQEDGLSVWYEICLLELNKSRYFNKPVLQNQYIFGKAHLFKVRQLLLKPIMLPLRRVANIYFSYLHSFFLTLHQAVQSIEFASLLFCRSALFGLCRMSEALWVIHVKNSTKHLKQPLYSCTDIM